MANETELNDFTKDELLGYADEFGVEVKHSQNKAAVVAAFEEDGITVELIHGLAQPTEEELKAEGLHPLAPEEVVEEAAPVEDDGDLVLVRMTRSNHTYEIRGSRFSQDHPYALVSEENADYLIEVDGGFRVASPKEAREFYS